MKFYTKQHETFCVEEIISSENGQSSLAISKILPVSTISIYSLEESKERETGSLNAFNETVQSSINANIIIGNIVSPSSAAFA